MNGGVYHGQGKGELMSSKRKARLNQCITPHCIIRVIKVFNKTNK